MGNRKEILNIVNNYLETNNTDFAILITGEWGSGKTYLWKNYLFPELQETYPNKKIVYISLNGTTDSQDIARNIFFELYLNIKKKVLNIGGQIVKLYLENSNFKINDKKIPYDKLIKTTDLLLCFDDVERSDISIENLFGFFNKFIEHENIKTILICDESKITDEKYKKIREKTIGIIQRYSPDFHEVLEDLFQLIKKSDEKYYNYLNKNTELIYSLFIKSETNNFRILRRAIQIFHQIFKKISKIIPNDEIYNSYLTFFLPIYFEENSGELDKKDILYLIENKDIALMLSVEDSNDIFTETKEVSRKYYLDFLHKYFDNDFYDFFTSKCIFEYIIEGNFDDKLFESEIEILNAKITCTHKDDISMLLWEFWKLSDTEFQKTYNKIVTKVTEGSFNYPYEYLTIFTRFIYFSKSNIIQEQLSDLLKLFTDGINKGVEKGLKPNLDRISQIHGESEPKDNEYKEFKDKVIRLNGTLIEDTQTEKGNMLNEIITNDFNHFIRIIDDESNSEGYRHIPIFKFIPIEIFIEKVVGLPNSDIIKLRNMFLYRYEKNVNNLTDDEKTNLVRIISLLDEECSKLNSSVKKHVLFKIIESLKNILDKY